MPDHDLAEPADDEEERREHDPPETQLRQAERGPEVEHVPGDPEDERTEQDRRGKCGERHCEPTGDESPDPRIRSTMPRTGFTRAAYEGAPRNRSVLRRLGRTSRDG